MTPILILGIGLLMAAMLAILALVGPSAGKATARRLETLKDRHSTSATSKVSSVRGSFTSNVVWRTN